MGEERIRDILQYITKIRESEQSIRGYFENNYAPFFRVVSWLLKPDLSNLNDMGYP